MSCQAGTPVLGLERGAEQLPWEAENRDFAFRTLGRGCRNSTGGSGVARLVPLSLRHRAPSPPPPTWDTSVPPPPPASPQNMGQKRPRAGGHHLLPIKKAEADGEGNSISHLPKYSPSSSPEVPSRAPPSPLAGSRAQPPLLPQPLTNTR